MFLSIDGTFWIQILNFFVFFAILNVVYLKPAGAALRKRRAYIDSVHSEFEKARHEIHELEGQTQAKRAEARREGDQRAAVIRGEAQKRSDAMTIDAQGKASTIVEAAQQEVAAEVKAASAQEETLVKDLASTMLSRAMGTRP